MPTQLQGELTCYIKRNNVVVQYPVVIYLSAHLSIPLGQSGPLSEDVTWYKTRMQNNNLDQKMDVCVFSVCLCIYFVCECVCVCLCACLCETQPLSGISDGNTVRL